VNLRGECPQIIDKSGWKFRSLKRKKNLLIGERRKGCPDKTILIQEKVEEVGGDDRQKWDIDCDGRSETGSDLILENGPDSGQAVGFRAQRTAADAGEPVPAR
jgi:hypothetical protein